MRYDTKLVSLNPSSLSPIVLRLGVACCVRVRDVDSKVGVGEGSQRFGSIAGNDNGVSIILD